MNKQNENSLVIKSETLFDKIKAFFKLFFEYIGINEKSDFDNEKDVDDNNEINNNLENIQEYTEENYEEKLQDLLVELQETYETGIIKEEELTKEQAEDLKKLYILQINYLKDSIEKNQAVILKLKEKIDIIDENK